MKRYILAHDLGTSGDKASLVGIDGAIVRAHTHPYPAEHPRPGWAQQDPALWWEAFCLGSRALLEGVDPAEVAGVCLTGQMMCCLPVDRYGVPLHPAMIWADGRASEEAEELVHRLGGPRFHQLTGMRASANYGLPKMMWLKKHLPETYRKTHRFLSPKDYINHRLTGRFATDPESAAFMHCYDWSVRGWSDEVLAAAGIGREKLPELLGPSDPIGPVRPDAAAACGLAAGTPVVMGPGDGSAATLGACVLKPGEAYTSLGTSSWVCVISGNENLDPKQRIAKLNYLGTLRDSGTMQAGGYAYRWMETVLCARETARAQKEALSAHRLVDEFAQTSPPGAGGVLFQPYLMGERAPLWDTRMRGAFIGLTAKTTRADLCRSVMEGVALHLGWIYRCILEASGMDGVSCMRIVGGGAKSQVWTQIFADVFGMPVEITGRPDHAGALGTAVVAGVGLGLYESYSVIRKFQPITRTVNPEPSRLRLYAELGEILEESASAMARVHHRLGGLSALL